MWPIKIPTHGVEETFRECISRARMPARAELLAAVPEVLVAAAKSEAAFQASSAHLLIQSDFESVFVTADELEATYEGRMVPSKSPGRHIYDELKLAAPDGLCPACGQRPVSQLDHLLPKALYPLISVCPTNLVPACGDCNHTKLASVATTADDVPLHPYYDNIDSDIWLVADVIEGSPAAAKFRVDPPSFWDPTLIERVRRHFTAFGLAKLYSAQAGVEIRGIDIATKRAYERGGATEVRLQLSDQVAGRQMRFLNNWQAATYRALARSDWYCEGRFS